MAFLRRLRLVLVAYPASATRTARPFSKTNFLRQQVRVQDSRVLQQPPSRSAHTAHGAGRDPFLRFRSGLAVRESHELNLREGRRARLPANKTIQSFSRQLKDLRSVAPFAYQSDDGTRSARWASPQRTRTDADPDTVAGGPRRPHCSEAWDVVSRYIYTGLQGGSIMRGWMERENEMICCCNDGTRPVIFKLERIDIPEGGE